ncbi:hypothetical protein BDZ89DRAFT_1036218 [Hymenopellis radicata]|nr:hypothetical protein BDZ89DRAFT_1036218 [Hymenopellis radicata]
MSVVSFMLAPLPLLAAAAAKKLHALGVMDGISRSRSLEDASIAEMPLQNAVLSVRAQQRIHSQVYSHATNGPFGLLPPELLGLIISHFIDDTPPGHASVCVISRL